jgi:L-2-hydroxyglutarate oxidase LhgO
MRVPSSSSVDAIVVGAGVIGLAIARALALSGLDVVVLEAERDPGQHATSRNSEVIHAGLYYPAGSLKATSCVAGRRRLLEYCEARRVAHRLCGKLIVATSQAELGALADVHARAAACGVELASIDGSDAKRRVPGLACIAALVSAGTGIVDSHGLVRALWGDASDRGASLARATSFVRAESSADGMRVWAGDDVVECRMLVNAAGMHAPAVARAIDAVPPSTIPPARLAKGSYFAVQAPLAMPHLVYPVPEPGGLGIHTTIDLAGGVRLGPDVEWIDAVDYGVDPGKADAFWRAATRYLPALPRAALVPAYAGIRAKIVGPGEPAGDFLVHGDETHGVRGLVQLFGIESPGLTACLALAELALARLGLDRPC